VKTQAAAEYKLRFNFVSVGEKPGTRGPVVGVYLMGNNWTQAEREAAERENAPSTRVRRACSIA